MESGMPKTLKGPTVNVTREWRQSKFCGISTSEKKPPKPGLLFGAPQKATSYQRDATLIHDPDKKTENPAAILKFEFVNATTKPDRNRDPEIRKFVRKQVMKNRSSTKKQQQYKVSEESQNQHKLVSKKKSSSKARSIANRTNSLTNPPRCLRDIIDTPGVHLEPSSQHLLLYYCDVVANAEPLNSHLTENICSEAWLRLAMVDEASIHALLYTAAVGVTLYEGSREMRMANIEMSRTLRLLKDRLQESQTGVSDAVLGAVSCLAFGTAQAGHFTDWKAHMSGVRQIIQMRGGMSTLDNALQVKLFRADLAGAVDVAATPYLEFSRPDMPALSSRLGLLESNVEQETLLQVLAVNNIEQPIIDAFKDLRGFSQAISYAMSHKSILLDHIDFITDTYSIKYQLLRPKILERSSINEACRIVALIYLRKVLGLYPFAMTGPRYLITKLKESLGDLTEINESSAPLALWILNMAGISATTGPERMWFVAHLVRISAILKLDRWEDARCILEDLIWIKQIHESSCEALWDEVQVTKSVLLRTSECV